MRFKKMLIVFFTIFLTGAIVFAQDITAPVKEVQSSTNMLAILMIIISIIFAFVIYAMGQVLLTLIRQVLDKNKALKEKAVATMLLLVLLFTGGISEAQDTGTVVAQKVLPNYGGLDATAFWVLVSVICIEVTAILVILFFIKRIQQELTPAKEKVRSRAFSDWWAKANNKFFTKAVPLEKEADVLLDHDYDGIKELDNALPPWWKYGFIVTVFFAVVYLLHFHVLGSGDDPTQEYQAELARADKQMAAYAAKNKDKVDENNIVMADATGIAAGKEIFQQACWACHGKLGEGGAGPNLTDDYWIHKGSLNDIYKSLKLGYPEKGMQAWEKQYSPKQLSEITSYIKSLRGTNPPNGKASQGELFTENAMPDSATVTTTNTPLKN
jgi:cytochrome c oxidase cbb3-type subunit III